MLSELRTGRHAGAIGEAATLAGESLRAQPLRSSLAILGVVIGIVTVVLVASTLVGLRNSVALLFRELGTDNIFAYHLNGEPYAAPSEQDAQRPQMLPEYAPVIARLGGSVRDVGIQLIVPVVTESREGEIVILRSPAKPIPERWDTYEDSNGWHRVYARSRGQFDSFTKASTHASSMNRARRELILWRAKHEGSP